ncbi:MipA/OmpV family protein [Noviherbaspirillum suwonense]|jgi:outer membrane protein|uniref:Outer membrane scaffolding protein for murein synthesis, MipA/OmpV family n=1 Tax=Noviherbaspirillum suwonense TaxID=1224511 RepID=A0ABY1QP48_9BURK|nr:MipA/OmpV family protein [Noviherbaspirillum suwonense]SMP74056.1 Outer membrane scaffolding protein for murein synthesis, MipA/OmpV family [Noviherbaspirillum suwonense]
MQIPSFRRLAVPATACALLAALPAAAEPLPLWEAGLGVAAVTLPDYRGADSSQTYVLPAPYFVYRGEFLKADRNGVRSTLFNTERVELNISLNATLPVSSKNNTVRQGMASLRPTVELGPTLSVNLWKADSGGMKLDLRTPLRTAVTIESSPRQIGWLFAPNLNLDVRDPFGMSGWNLGMLAGPNFQSRRYNRYFYSVGDADATAARPRYDAPGGYAGSQFTAAVSKRFERYWVGAFLRYDALGGASFEDSPLVQRKNAVSAGVAVTWVFGQSAAMVDASRLGE